MKDETYEKTKELSHTIVDFTANEIISLTDEIDKIINTKCENEKVISYVFDRILSIIFLPKEDLESLYYRLLNYTKEFNKELSSDYEKIFIEHFSSLDK